MMSDILSLCDVLLVDRFIFIILCVCVLAYFTFVFFILGVFILLLSRNFSVFFERRNKV